MTGKVLNTGSAGILILILPLAFAFVLLYKLWPFILLLAVLIVAFKVWQEYQWRKWCEQIDPYFNQVIKENQGYLTSIDLSVKANINGRAAMAFLTRKSDEYGVEPQKIKDKGVIYYFPTASALGSIFDDSDIADDSDTEPILSYQLAANDSKKYPLKGIAQLAKEQQSQKDSEESTVTKSGSVAQLTKPETATEEQVTSEENNPLSIDISRGLIQAELAKRLDVNSSTVGRRKSDPDFPEWSQSKDPEGLAWEYIAETKMYVVSDSN
ncbi:MAG: hypothetical protein ACFCU5_15720 [Pleurocapsa sp.]